MSSTSKEICDEWDWGLWAMVNGARVFIAVFVGVYAYLLVNLDPGITAASGLSPVNILCGICALCTVAYQIVVIIPLEGEGIASKVFSVITVKTGTALPFLLQVLL